MKSINCSKKRRQTPPWLVKHFKRSFESLYASNKRSKSPNYDYNSLSLTKIPQMIYLPPKHLKIPSSVTVPKDLSLNVNSSFKIYASKSASNGNLSNYKSRTPEKYFSPLKSDWKGVDAVAKVKRGRSAVNLRSKNSSTERSPNPVENQSNAEKTKNDDKKRFNKKYIKRKLAKIFRSTGKLDEIHNSDVGSSIQNTKREIDLNPATELQNDALRNLSFTAAMMSKDTKLISRSKVENKVEDQTKQIPSSTLRFWKKPCEEKIKAGQRRIQDNIYGSNEVLLRINPTSDYSKIPSELSLFSEELNHDLASDFGKLCFPENKSSIVVSGYDKAFQRYQNIVSQSHLTSRKDRTLSVAYDTENVSQNANLKMRTCQSSGNVNILARSTSIVNYTNNNDDIFRVPGQAEPPKIQHTQMMCPKRHLTPNQLTKPNVPSISPPAYDRMLANNRRSRTKVATLTPTSCYPSRPNSHTRIQPVENVSRKVPVPPPRSDSLIRSFELICQNLQTSISEPRGDSFKIFKNQTDYQAWLRNLPYHNPDKISTLLRMRSKAAKRQCVSELLDFEVSDFNLNNKRRHSWPLLKCTNYLSDSISTKRSSSLCRVKKKINPINETKMALESPSLYNYSRLYCLRNSKTAQNEQSTKNMPSYKIESIKKQRPLILNPKSSTFSIYNRRSTKHRQKQENVPNSRMTESCHESESPALI